MLPFSLGGALVALISGQIPSRLGDVRSIMWFAWTVVTLGFGLMIQLDDHSNKYVYLAKGSSTLPILRYCRYWLSFAVR